MLDGEGGGGGDPGAGLRAAIPALRRAARDLLGDPAEADAAVVDTLVAALRDRPPPDGALEARLLADLRERAASRTTGGTVP